MVLDSKSTSPAVPPSKTRKKLRSLMMLGAVFGPGVMVMLADTDAGSIITAARHASHHGGALLVISSINLGE